VHHHQCHDEWKYKSDGWMDSMAELYKGNIEDYFWDFKVSLSPMNGKIT
jgi:hypothetical protein